MWRFQACLALYSQENNFERSITETTAERMGILFLWQTKKKRKLTADGYGFEPLTFSLNFKYT